MELEKRFIDDVKSKQYKRFLSVDTESAINVEERTAELAFVSDVEVKRHYGGEVINMRSVAENSERLNSSAPLLRNHDWESHIGVIIPGTVRVDADGVARCKVKFSRSESGEDAFRDAQDGILVNVSVGYRVLDMRLKKEKEDGYRVYDVDVDCFEVSMVSVPADFEKSGLGRSNEEVVNVSTEINETEVNINNVEDLLMKDQNNVEAIDKEKISAEARSEGVAEGRTLGRKDALAYVNEVRQLCEIAGSDKADAFIKEEKDLSEVRAALWNDKVEANKEEISNIASIESDVSHTEKRMAEVEQSVLHHLNSAQHKAADTNIFTGSFLDLARDIADARGIESRIGTDEMVGMFLKRTHSTDDWAASDIFANVMNKDMNASFEALLGRQAWRFMVEEKFVRDFKKSSESQLGEYANLLEMDEGSEYKGSTMSSQKEEYAVKKHGRKFSITEEMLINDDMGAFNNAGSFGTAAARSETAAFYEQLFTGTVRGTPLFDPAHNNSITASSFDEVAIGDAMTKLMLQEGIDVKEPLDLVGEYLLAPAAMQRVVQQYTSKNYTADSQAKINPFDGQLTPVFDGRLDKNSANVLYMAAGKGQIRSFIMAYLSGQRNPVLSQRVNWDNDSIDFKIKHTYGCKAMEYRGLVKMTITP